MSVLRPRSRSVDLQHESKPISLIDMAKGEMLKKAGMLWDNSFFDRLFPHTKQQKPGLNLYVGIAGVSILIILYIILLFSPMQGTNNSTISQQFNSNQFSGAMVLTMIGMIAIMVIDRYLYST